MAVLSEPYCILFYSILAKIETKTIKVKDSKGDRTQSPIIKAIAQRARGHRRHRTDDRPIDKTIANC
ncbi:MAG: hypothetical protein EAZ60_22605 [Oscillatoriales cyanobacterium]|nr:MAG: hypothetical protein EAZ60_22605 [Oscillatoriales cyanobacterium]